MLRKALASYLAAAVFIISMAPAANAGFVPTGKVLPPSVERAADMAGLQAALEERLVRQRLSDLGYSPDEISSRMARLSDEQLHAVSRDLDQIRSGGTGIIEALLIVFLVIVILDLTGNTSIIIKNR